MYTVILFYKYVSIKDPKELMDFIRGLATGLSLKGRVIIAAEGINATLEGQTGEVLRFAEIIKQDRRFRDIQIKTSLGNGSAFPKLSVKVREEIVGTKFSKDIDPRKKTGKYLRPEELHELYEKNDDFVMVDMRNSYEYASGHFKNAVDPGLEASRDLPNMIEKLREYKPKKVVTYCTGGVRCEKMSAYLLAEGFENVYQLEGGIHSYMEKYPGKNFAGTLYTFDNRDTMHFGGEREIVGRCKRCGEKTESYYNCANDECHLHFLACEKCVSDKKYVFCSSACETAPSRLAVSKR